MDFEAKSDELWFHIARFIYQGVYSYLAVVAFAILRDLSRKTLFPHKTRLMFRNSRFSPVQWHRSFISKYRDTRVFYYVEILRLALNITICAIYVIGTYKQNVIRFISTINRVFGAFFLLSLISNIVSAESAISYVFTVFVFFDAFSYPSLFSATGPDAYLNFSFVRALDAYDAYRRLERRLFVQMFGARRLFVKLAFQCFTLFYTLAAGIQLLEIPGDLLSVRFRERWFQFGEWNFMNAWYFVIVTLSTVGYGDFSPATVQGRIFTLFMIIVGIVLFTSVISEIVEQASKSRGTGWFVKSSHTRHVIVTGTPTMTDLVHFVSEFYSDPRLTNVKAKIVVLEEDPPWSDTEWFQQIARNQFLQARLQFLRGCARNVSDLQRARIGTADAFFILTSPSTGEDPSVQDTRTIMNVLAIRNVRTDIPIYAQTLLEDSNLQTHLALATASSFSKEKTIFRGAQMGKDASYTGLFCKVLRTEYNELPLMHKVGGRHSFEEIYGHHVSKESAIDIHAVDSCTDDLLRSQLVCLQEVHMALISGNIKVNGVGTLISNMYLDVQIPKLSKEDPAWLAEYHMGAACSLAYAIIPDRLDGVPVKEVAGDLFFLGLILIATSDPQKVCPRPVLGTDSVLRQGDLAMLLTYHEYRYVGAALQLVALRYSREGLRHPIGPSSSSGDTLMCNHAFKTDLSRLSSDARQMSSGTSGVHDEAHAMLETSGDTDNLGHQSSTPAMRLSGVSADDLDAIADLLEHDTLGGELQASATSDALLENRSDGYMPDNLSGHIIISMEGEAPLRNLPLLLQNLWRQDKRRSMRNQRRARIVVIHPCLSDDVRAKFARFEGTSLFFVIGCPASRATWRKARLRTAKSVATVADYTKPWTLSDARTIFTLLTLDASTGVDQDLFICSELVDEKSLEFLREPIHPRRRGAKLGESAEQSSLGTHPVSPVIDEDFDPVSPSANRGRNTAEEEDDEITCALESGTRVVQDVESPRVDRIEGDGVKVAVAVGEPNGVPGRKSGKIRDRMKGRKSGKIGGYVEGAKSAMSGEVKSFVRNTITTPDLNRPEEDSGVDPSVRPGAARARRGTLFSRSRYASGELLVQSSAITLLVREYIEPGFVKFFTNILGTETSSPGMKIRLVRIPQAFFDPHRGLCCHDGRKLVRYYEIFKVLVRLGVTPLGIYRSGSAPALIPAKQRKKRGPAICAELEPILEAQRDETPRHKKKSRNPFSRASQYLYEAVRDILPYHMQEAQGRHEVHGKSGHFHSSTEEDSSDEELGFDDEDTSHSKPTPDPQTQSPLPDKCPVTSSTESGNGAAADDAGGNRAGFARWVSPKAGTVLSKIFANEDGSKTRGKVNYSEQRSTGNLLPYVYTLPDPNTLCAETDGIYIMCHPCFDLPDKWHETSCDITRTA